MQNVRNLNYIFITSLLLTGYFMYVKQTRFFYLQHILLFLFLIACYTSILFLFRNYSKTLFKRMLISSFAIVISELLASIIHNPLQIIIMFNFKIILETIFFIWLTEGGLFVCICILCIEINNP